jgi:hypothetical protein
MPAFVPALRRLATAAAVAIGLLGPIFASTAGEPGRPAHIAADARAEADGAAALLAQRYAPVYHLTVRSNLCARPGEAFEPLSVDTLLSGNSAIELSAGGTRVSAPTGADIEGLGRDAYLDLPGDPRRAGCSYARLHQSLSEGSPPTVYARIARETGKPGFALQFWSFWLFNDWNNTHEGDWELVQLIFDAATVDEALERGPVSVAYAQHGLGERRSWHDHEVRKVGQRPAVYVATGSHASYFRPGVYVGLGQPGRGVGCDVAAGPHRTVEPRVATVPSDPTGMPAYAWLTFRGSWGEKLDSDFAGPRGPITKRAWGSPISWSDDLDTSSRRLASVEPLGADSIGTLCALVSDGAWVARAFMGSPFLLAGLGVPVAAAGAGTTTLVVRRRPWRTSITSRRHRGFLQEQRSLVHLPSTAALIYLERPRLFLGIALAFLPLQLLFGFAQALLPDVAPAGEIWPRPSNLGSRWAAELAVAGLQSVLAYVFVLGGTLAAIGMLNRGESPTVLAAYGQAIRRAPHLLLARGATVAGIVALSLSFVGIPLAVWFAARWFFLEAAVMIDRAPGWRAPGDSAAAVATSPLRAITVGAAFGGLAVGAGVVIAGFLLLSTSLEPWQVNALAGLGHLVVLPFCALGLALGYGDLRHRSVSPGSA